MSDETKTYHVKTVYEIVDKLSKPINEIKKSSEDAAKNLQNLKNLVYGFAVMKIGGGGLKILKDEIFGLNSALEQSTMKLAGVTSMATGVDLEQSWDRATKSLERYTDMSWDSGVETADLMKHAAELQGPMLQAGVSIRKIEEMSHGAVKAAGAYGMEASEMTASLTRAFTTGVKEKDMVMRALLSQKEVGLSIKQFNAMSMGDRADALKKALNTKALSSFVDKQSDETFEGVTGDIKSHLKNIAVVAGQPIFAALTKEMKTWELWLVANRKELEAAARVVGDKLVAGFRIVKDVFVWLYDHRDILIMIAKAYAAIKVGSMVGGALGEGMNKLRGLDGETSLFTKLGDLGAKVDSEGKKVTSRFSAIAAAAGPVIGAFSGGWMIGTMILDAHRRAVKADKEQTGRSGPLVQAIAEGAADDPNNARGREGMFRAARTMGLLKKDWLNPRRMVVDQEMLAASVGRQNEYRMSQAGFGPGYDKSITESIAEMKLLRMAIEGWRVDLKGASGAVSGGLAVALILANNAKQQDIFEKMAGFQAKSPEQNINITIQQVTAKDPNRWIADMDDMVARRTRAKTRAKKSWKVSTG